MARAKITYDIQLIKVISLFEGMTGAAAKDCLISNDMFYFVVEPENMGRAIGKKGVNVKRLESMLKKKVKIIEFNPDLATFINNLIYPLAAKQIAVSNGKVTITGPDQKTRAMLIGRNSSNLNNYKGIIQRYFDIREIRVN